MEVSTVRSTVLADRNFSSTESSCSKGPLWSPARTIEKSQEGTRGCLEGFILLATFRNLTMRSCFPRDRPSTASWWAAIAATCTFKVEGDSLRSKLSFSKESTTSSTTTVECDEWLRWAIWPQSYITGQWQLQTVQPPEVTMLIYIYILIIQYN